jgi:hypothetical protein
VPGDKRQLTTITLRLPRAQITRLEMLRKALEEKMNKTMTKSDLIEKIIDDFLEK